MPPETVSQGALSETQLSICARAVRWVGLPDPGPSVLRPPGLLEPYELGLGCERTIWFAESHSSKRESERRAPEIDPGE